MKRVLSSLTLSIQRYRYLVTKSRIREFTEDRDYFLLNTMSQLGERFKMEAKNIDTVSLYIRYASMIDFITIILLVDL